MAVNANRNRGTTVRKVHKDVSRLNDTFNKFIDTLTGSSNDRERELHRLEDEIEEIISDDINHIEQFTGKDISGYLTKILSDKHTNPHGDPKSFEDIFSDESSGIFGFFNERYRNTNLLYEDLKVVSSQLFELKEAINTTRDSIVASDDLGASISRGLLFSNKSESESSNARSVIENLEQRFDLHDKIKNHIIPNTLSYGKYYVYTVPYSAVFAAHERRNDKLKKSGKLGATTEAFSLFNQPDETAIKSIIKEATSLSTVSRDTITSVKELFSSVDVLEDDLPLPLMESSQDELNALFNTDEFKKMRDKKIKEAQKAASGKIHQDATVDLNDKYEKQYEGIQDCYVKLIDPRFMIPVKILDKTIGYYYVHQVELGMNRSPFTNTIKANFGHMNAKQMETNILTKITDRIVKSFNKSYLEENKEFKSLILNALMYNDIYSRQVKFQFIPVDYITEFHVNKDELGEGQSIIAGSLFYAKLYLSLLIFKMLAIVSRSNDTRINYVKSAGLDNDIANKIQDVARSMRERQVNFMDMMNYNSMVSKIGQAKDVYIPIGRSGDRGIDFDILQGQNVELHSELMELLKNGYINSTGVPSVIMEYINQADYSRTLVMANAKFLGRVVSHQLDFNKSLTELYRKVIKFTGMLPDEDLDTFAYKLTPPKSLKNNNMTDMINSADAAIKFMISTITGEQSDQDEDALAIKDILYRKLAQDALPMLPWDSIDDFLKEAKIEVARRKQEKAIKTSNEPSDSEV